MITANFKYCNKELDCFDHNIYKITSYIDLIDLKISEINSLQIQKSKWGYTSKNINQLSFKKLLLYKKFLKAFQSYTYSEVGFEYEISETNIQKVLESVSYLIDYNKLPYCRNLKVKEDRSNQTEYLLLNPGCQPYEEWERYVLGICTHIHLTSKNITDSVKILYQVSSKPLVDNCKFFTTLSVITKAKEQKCFDVNISNLATCKLNYDLIISNYNCNLSFSNYINVLGSGISSKSLEYLLESGAKIEYLNDKLYLVVTGKYYELLGINVNSINGSISDEYISKVINNGPSSSVEVKEILKNSYSNLNC